MQFYVGQILECSIYYKKYIIEICSLTTEEVMYEILPGSSSGIGESFIRSIRHFRVWEWVEVADKKSPIERKIAYLYNKQKFKFKDNYL